MQLIHSAQNPRLKAAQKLRDRPHRQDQGRILIEGTREIRRAQVAGVSFVQAFCCPELCRTPESLGLLDFFRRQVAETYELPLALFRKLAFGDRAEGIIAIALPPNTTLDQIQVGAQSVVAVLEGIEKPGNIGAILRSADGAGVAGVIAIDGTTDLYSPNCIRASLGAVFDPRVVQANTPACLNWLRANAFAIFAARPDAAQVAFEAPLAQRVAFVLGSESHGLSTAWLAADVHAVRLPMLGSVDSLNVSLTAGVLFYEALRQRWGNVQR